jgi:hypothetical protein
MKIMPPSCPRFAPKLPPESYRAMRFAVLAHSAGVVLASQLFSSGFYAFLFVAARRHQCGHSLLSTLPNLMSFFLTLPFAYIADQFGKKRFGSYGLLGTVVGFALIASARLLADREKIGARCIGLSVFSASV